MRNKLISALFGVAVGTAAWTGGATAQQAVELTLWSHWSAEVPKRSFVEAAIAEFEKAKRLDPRSSLVHYRLGETYFKQSGFNLAANSFRDCLNGDLKPDWVEVWSHIHLGKIFDILGQRQRALAEYQKAINSQNDHEGAQEEAKKYLDKPFSRPSNVIGR